MTALKSRLFSLAHGLRLISRAIRKWPLVLGLACVVSPISPHVRLPYALTYSDCDYLGTRGLQPDAAQPACNLIELIDTRSGRRLSW